MSATVWIVLFRGVGGKTQLPVKPLREKLGAAGFDNVATYINSGNAVLSSDRPREAVHARIAEICSQEFGFEKDIHIVALAEWEQLIAENPFPDAVETPKFLHAAVLADKPAPARLAALEEVAQGGDRIAVVGKVAYLHTPNGFGTSKLAEKFDKGIGVATTARNWNTVLKLAELARAARG
ncbi:DUF1697 domain-containing protein [Nitratireductor mangrovi]|uniref:DUF1697 domain-containing protein n=1 Tax=Nitratireductor mangrovi TaxID=2599600 RepID=A0A5B8KVU0_9HYPH|nr:DUF1697 domain-containing protein [Nitratireductor mangrovi]QDY99661.1 DUF1697 domain-containing protein [Nitratireductor mangrovi]